MAGMLGQGDFTLTAVARECGYSNLASFSRDFSSLHSYPPSQLLRQA
jgi:transcriptional regulator GlxA family with amidase domain